MKSIEVSCKTYIFAGAPTITYDAKFKDQSMKAGHTLIILVDITGFPDPKVTWFHDDKELTQSDKVTIEGDNKFSRLTIKGTTGKNSGKYKVVAKNNIGEAEEKFDVTILGKIIIKLIR